MKTRLFVLLIVLPLLPVAVSAEQPGSVRGGSLAAEPAAARLRPASASMGLRLKLPFPEGGRFEVFQGHGGKFSHDGLNRYAWDFGLPEGTPVLAAAEGRVVRIKQDSRRGGVRPGDYAHGNTIVLDHGDGLFTQYLHLKANSARVREGELVRAGQILAESGNTGFSSTPHLHFQVQDALGQSLPARFLDVPGDGNPGTGDWVISGNDGSGTSPYRGESILPGNAFLGNGIVLEKGDLPAHLVRTDRSYTLAGTSPQGAKRIAVYVMKPDGGRPIHTVYCDVDHAGRFKATLDLAKLREITEWSLKPDQSNPFALAIAPVAEDGSFWSAFSVPITAR